MPFYYTIFGEKNVDLDIAKDVFPTDDEMKLRENELLENCQHGYFESTYKTKKLHYRYFLPTSTELKGIVVFHHGIQGHSGRAVPDMSVNTALLSTTLVEKHGFALYMLDALGHGFSEGERFYVPDYNINKNDLYNFVQFVNNKHREQGNDQKPKQQLPIFLMGESYGSCLCLHVAKMMQDDKSVPLTGVCITAPAIVESELPPYPIVFVLRYLLAPIFPKRTPFFMPNPVSANRIWRDEKIRNWYTCPRNMEMDLEGGGRPFRLGTGVQLLNALEDVRTHVIPCLENIPICACHGTDDMAVPIASLDFLQERLPASCRNESVFLRQDGAYHDMLADPTAENTLEFILNFMNERCDVQEQQQQKS